MSTTARRTAVAVAAALALLVIVVVAVGRGADPAATASSGSSTSTTRYTGTLPPPVGGDVTTTSTTTTTAAAPAAPTTSTTPTPSIPAPDAARRTPPTTVPMPLVVQSSPATGLHDGSVVKVQVKPTGGSQVFGFEAFLCKGGVDFRLDADIRPDETGKCVAHPLSAGSDDYKLVAVDPPYQSAETDFRVGVGTDTFQLRDGRTVSITCGPGNPCQIALKLQYPNAYGFQAIPVTFG